MHQEPKYWINRVENLTEIQGPTNVQVKEYGETQPGKIVGNSTYTIIPTNYNSQLSQENREENYYTSHEILTKQS